MQKEGRIFLISNCRGVMPVDFLNWREKYEIFWKPQVMAMSRMLISPFARSSLERAIRRSMM